MLIQNKINTKWFFYFFLKNYKQYHGKIRFEFPWNSNGNANSKIKIIRRLFKFDKIKQQAKNIGHCIDCI